LEERVSRAELRLLRCKAKAQPFPDGGLELFGLMSDDDHDGRRMKRFRGSENVVDEG
jgi:hypothetical protein